MDNLGIFSGDSYLFLRNDLSTDPIQDNSLEYSVVDKIFEKIDPSVGKESPKYDADRVIDMVQERFRIRREPHSIDRLKKVLKEDKFKDYYHDCIFDDVLKGLESNHRVFEKKKKSTKRNNRKRSR